MSYVFGPVPSRRLGLSLGVDLIPLKTCSFDCLYCEVGRTTCKTIKTDMFVPVTEVVSAVDQKLHNCVPDTITLAGSGEPTLYSGIDQVIDCIREMTEIKIALLTNGSLFFKKEIRQRVLKTDIILPTLCSAFEDTFRKIHRPHPGLHLAMIVDGLKKLRHDYKGKIFLEVVLLSGINDTEKELEGLKTLARQISPDQIQLNTVVRPPADATAISLDRKTMEDIKVFFGGNTEIVVEVPLEGRKIKEVSLINMLLDMIKIRPLSSVDISKALNIPRDEAEDMIKGLLIKGYIRKQEYSGKIFYLSNQSSIAGRKSS